MRAFQRLSGLIFLALLLSLSGCATTGVTTQAEIPARHSISEFNDQRFAEVSDPWEATNRSMYRFNFYFDKYLFLPVVGGYEYITPTFLQERISGFYSNLGELQNFSNSLFQLKGLEALSTLGRFVTNSTVGIGGLFDPATSFGLERRNQDFGKTLGYWGADSGPYLVLPVFGPSSMRDASGLVVDSAITYGVYSAIDPFGSSDYSFEIGAGITTLGFVDTRHHQSFRYFESGNPFEYYLVRFFYHEKREIESGKRSTKE
ncbi:phospholipid-binding lipoprotein MlaA [Trichlorobacter thiogenes]|uniref:Phospholipid-binding lipoprotein MlaA n=1 Tax=Trichlorobacter thiogenes TaxID=115783 RepID=A0A1T4QWA5_9BACT|nr:VacJ family lipoprotein [Trichlorobacter thiogenes]SKA08060.1 phospholipid-binding lipoprotein MlaA [Trichlorobacter thiogenes]